MVSFNEPVNAESLGGITHSANGSTVTLSDSLSSGSQLLTITPAAGLLPNTTYTLTINGVADQSGNAMTTATTSTFTTSGTVDLTAPVVTAISPAKASTGVPLNTSITVQFNKYMDALSINTSTFTITTNGNVSIAGILTTSADGASATLVPSSPLMSSTAYTIQISTGVQDIEGQSLAAFSSTFTTGTQ